jgi:hypothetical protein
LPDKTVGWLGKPDLYTSGWNRFFLADAAEFCRMVIA